MRELIATLFTLACFGLILFLAESAGYDRAQRDDARTAARLDSIYTARDSATRHALWVAEVERDNARRLVRVTLPQPCVEVAAAAPETTFYHRLAYHCRDGKCVKESDSATVDVD